MRAPYPLQWPDGWKRTPAADRKPSRFFYGFADSMASLMEALARIGATNIVITSDLPARPDGRPYAVGRKDADPGIAVWFALQGHERVISCDRWQTHAENMRAIALSIEAIRGLDRWGASDMVARAFAGFTALPAGPAGPAAPVTNGKRDWREVLGMQQVPGIYERPIDARTRTLAAHNLVIARRIYREKIQATHPDHGGDPTSAVELNVAMGDAERALSW